MDDELDGVLHWPKSSYEVDPLSQRGIAEFLERCRRQERLDRKHEKKVQELPGEVINSPAQCVLVSDGTVRNPTIRTTTDDEPGERAKPGLGTDENGAIAGGAEQEERPVAGDHDGNADE